MRFFPIKIENFMKLSIKKISKLLEKLNRILILGCKGFITHFLNKNKKNWLWKEIKSSNNKSKSWKAFLKENNKPINIHKDK